MAVYYVLKVKGKAKIPDYIQVRDADFTLIGYFRPGREQRGSKPSEQSEIFQVLEEQVADLAPGIVRKIELA